LLLVFLVIERVEEVSKTRDLKEKVVLFIKTFSMPMDFVI